MLGGAREMMRAEAAERLQIFKESLFERRHKFPQGRAGFADALDDLVLDVGDVHHVSHLVTTELEITPDEIGEDKGAEIADMPEVINRRPAAIHPDFLAIRIQRHKLLDGAGKGVEDFQGHRSNAAPA